MKLFGLLIPAFRKGTLVAVADPVCARGQLAESIFRYFDPDNRYRKSLYAAPKKGAKGQIVSLIKYKDSSGDSSIYYGVLIKEVLYAIEESNLANA